MSWAEVKKINNNLSISLDKLLNLKLGKIQYFIDNSEDFVVPFSGLYTLRFYEGAKGSYSKIYMNLKENDIIHIISEDGSLCAYINNIPIENFSIDFNLTYTNANLYNTINSITIVCGNGDGNVSGIVKGDNAKVYGATSMGSKGKSVAVYGNNCLACGGGGGAYGTMTNTERGHWVGYNGGDVYMFGNYCRGYGGGGGGGSSFNPGSWRGYGGDGGNVTIIGDYARAYGGDGGNAVEFSARTNVTNGGIATVTGNNTIEAINGNSPNAIVVPGYYGNTAWANGGSGGSVGASTYQYSVYRLPNIVGGLGSDSYTTNSKLDDEDKLSGFKMNNWLDHSISSTCYSNGSTQSCYIGGKGPNLPTPSGSSSVVEPSVINIPGFFTYPITSGSWSSNYNIALTYCEPNYISSPKTKFHGVGYNVNKGQVTAGGIDGGYGEFYGGNGYNGGSSNIFGGYGYTENGGDGRIPGKGKNLPGDTVLGTQDFSYPKSGWNPDKNLVMIVYGTDDYEW